MTILTIIGHYGNTGCWVFKRGIHNRKDFWININCIQMKLLNFDNRTNLSCLQKSEFLKLIISLFHYIWCQNWDQWHKMSGKNTHIYFFYFWFKNKRVWAEKIGKKRKKFQKPKSCRQLKFIYSEKAIKFCEIFTLLLTGTT